MSTKAHTPTPWHVMYPKAFDYKIVESIGDRVIAHIDGQYPDQDDKDDNEDRHHADAKIIVTAVNHHDELRTRLYNLVNIVETIIGNTSGECPRGVNVSNFNALKVYCTEASETLKQLEQ